MLGLNLESIMINYTAISIIRALGCGSKNRKSRLALCGPGNDRYERLRGQEIKENARNYGKARRSKTKR